VYKLLVRRVLFFSFFMTTIGEAGGLVDWPSQWRTKGWRRVALRLVGRHRMLVVAAGMGV